MHELLYKMLDSTELDTPRRLRALWALHVTGGLTPERIERGLQDAGQFVRAWTVQLALENRSEAEETRWEK